MAQTSVMCANPECRVAETAKCIEGVDLNACPHYGKPAKVASDTIGATPPAVQPFRFHPGEYLALPEATAILLRYPSRVISVIGPSDAGKTSLIAALFELFHQNRGGSIRFAGCRSLFAFERACFHSRITSAGLKPTHEHTRRGPANYYHLCLTEQAGPSRVDLLLADRAGEEYSEAADRPVVASDFPEMWRADTITLLVDGGRLTDPAQRFDVIPNLKLMLGRFAELGQLWNRPQLACVLTKLDVVRDKGAAWPSEQLARLKDDITTKHGEYFSAIEIFEVAASPHSGSAIRGEGVLNVLNFWMQARPQITVDTTSTASLTGRFFAALSAQGDAL